MSDGAVHGLYAKWSEVKDQLLMGVTARLDALELRFDEYRTKRLCIEDETGEVCVSKDQLKMMIDGLATPAPDASSSGSVE
jgi:methyl coenzyme M reductase gamma subunit